MQKKIRAVGLAVLVAVWVALTAFAWFGPANEYSDTERRNLAQAPAVSMEAIEDGSFMKDFEDFTLDQFPLRESFRSLKALTHFYGLQQLDKNGLYIANGYLADTDAVVNDAALEKVGTLWNGLYQRLLAGTNAKVYFAVIPDKGYYLSQKSGHMALDPAQVEATLAEALPWATNIDIKDTLTLEDYYRTDTHWRQEQLEDTAHKISAAMGMPHTDTYTPKLLDRPFYGVYYGQVAVPVKPDSMYVMESQRLSQCTVNSYLTGSPVEISFYDLENLNSEAMKDPYNIFLHGSGQSFVVIENPNATTDRELVLFRDSYGCSIAPLLVADYARVTVIDLRVTPSMSISMMNRMGVFNLEKADVLFLYSTMVLNNPDSFQVN